MDNTTTSSSSITDVETSFNLGILKICLFSTFFVLGLIGNSLVLIGIAIADVLFIIVCIPTTLVSFFGRWPFASVGCKLAQFINHLSAFMSIYLLVFMSIDRYFAVVHAMDLVSTYRTIKNTTTSIIILWLVGITICIPIGSLFTVIEFDSSPSMYCLLRFLQVNSSGESNITNTTQTEVLPIAASLYWFGFVVFLYALPLTIIIIIYGLMLEFLRGARGQSVGKGKRRAIRMILAVILTYALCWFFMQLLFVSNIILSSNAGHKFDTYMEILNMLANVFAYLNSCTNPILYGFLSKNFRTSFIDLLCCRYSRQKLFGVTESLRARRATDTKSDYLLRTSLLSRTSQLNNLQTTALGPIASRSLPPMTNSNQERKQSRENNIPEEIDIELNDRYRQEKASDQVPVVARDSLVRRPTEVLYI